MIPTVVPIVLSATPADGGLISNLSTNMSTLTELVSSLFGVIGGTPVLAVMFTAGLAGIGFKFIRRAKKTAK